MRHLDLTWGGAVEMPASFMLNTDSLFSDNRVHAIVQLQCWANVRRGNNLSTPTQFDALIDQPRLFVTRPNIVKPETPCFQSHSDECRVSGNVGLLSFDPMFQEGSTLCP